MVNHAAELANALDRLVSAPQDVSTQAQVASARDQLIADVNALGLEQFPPLWIEAIEDAGLWETLGPHLLDRIERTFSRSQITPQEAATELRAIADEIAGAQGTLNHLVEALTALNIGAEEIEPGAAEVGVLIPRRAVDGELQQLGKEFLELERMIGPFVELTTGSRPPLHVNAISSSEFGIFLDIPPVTAAAVACAIERIIKGYKTVLEVRLLRRQLKEQGVSDERMEGIGQHADEVMGGVIDEAVDEALAEANDRHDSGRRNELRTSLSGALRSIAGRIDNGYNFEVRAEPPEGHETADEPAAEGVDDPYARVARVAPRLEFIRPEGEPILSLPHRSSEEPPAGEVTADGNEV
jgi:hypothetical protein